MSQLRSSESSQSLCCYSHPKHAREIKPSAESAHKHIAGNHVGEMLLKAVHFLLIPKVRNKHKLPTPRIILHILSLAGMIGEK